MSPNTWPLCLWSVQFNRVVAEELAKHIDPALPDKTLIFAATDADADIVVAAIKKAFAVGYSGIDDAAVRKITGSVDKVQTLIRSFRNAATRGSPSPSTC